MNFATRELTYGMKNLIAQLQNDMDTLSPAVLQAITQANETMIQAESSMTKLPFGIGKKKS